MGTAWLECAKIRRKRGLVLRPKRLMPGRSGRVNPLPCEGRDIMSVGAALLGVRLRWFPQLLLIAIWGYWMRMTGRIRAGRMTRYRHMEELLKEMKRRNAALEKVVTGTEEHHIRLEARRSNTA